jgi:hypothetical protein
MKVICKLVSVDYSANTGKFYTRKENETKWTVVTVNIDPLLMYRILHRKDDKKLLVHQNYVNHEFTSEIDSPSYRANPFILKRFVPVEGSDIPEHYTLDVVDHFTINLRERINMKMVDYESVSHLLGKYVREAVYEVKAMADPSKRQFVPAKLTTAVIR